MDRNNNQATNTSLQTRAAENLNTFKSFLQFSGPGWNTLVYKYIPEICIAQSIVNLWFVPYMTA